MGIISILTGRKRLKTPAADRLFAMSTAYVTMEIELQVTSRGCAAIVFQPLATADFEQIATEMEEVAHSTTSELGGTMKTSQDEFGYRWIMLYDDEFEDLVVEVNAVSSALADGGYGDRILCAVFAFQDTRGQDIYLIYNYKRGKFYPFVPAGSKERNNEREFQLKAQLTRELPFEPELERWFPLWGIPI